MGSMTNAKVESLKRITKVLGPMAEKLYEELVEEYGGKRIYKRGEEKLAVYYTICRILERMEKRIKENIVVV
jgi:hypothetical protein